MSFEFDEQNQPGLSDEDRESHDNNHSITQQLSYALSKQVPEIRRGAVFNTGYGELTLDDDDSRRVADLVESLLRARLASDSAHARKKPTLKAVPVKSTALEGLQTKVAMLRNIVRELRQSSDETCAVSLLLKNRLEENAGGDNDDVTLRLSFSVLSQRLEDGELDSMLSARIDELAAMVGLEAAEVANG